MFHGADGGFLNLRVESERWKGAVPPEAAARWTERATGVQPRRTVCKLDVPVQVEVPLGDGTASVDIEWSATDYPANSALSVTKSTGAATWSGERSGWQIDASAGRVESLYPAAPAKNAATSELALELESPPVVDGLSFAVEVAHSWRPAAPGNDRDDVALSALWSGTWDGISLSLEASETSRRYPNDPSRLGTRTAASAVDAELPFAGGDLRVEWESESVRTENGSPSVDTATFAIDWDYEGASVAVSLSVDWSRRTDWEDPGDDREILRLAAELTIAF